MQPNAGVPLNPQPVGQPPVGYPSYQPAPPQAPAPLPPPPPPDDYNQPFAPTPAGGSRFNLKSKAGAWLFAVFFALVGGITTYLIFAQSSNTINYYWYSSRFDATFWDGQVHTKPMDCLTNHFVCHDNGDLVFTGGLGRAWQSNPKNNNTVNQLKSPTWYGPYVYSPEPYKAYGFGITGQQQACFYVKDVSPKGVTAKMTFRVDNAQYGGIPAKVILTQQGLLASPDFKKRFTPICFQYFNATKTFAQQYRAYVNTGTVQISYVDHLIQAYTYDYNPYPYPYNAITSSFQRNTPADQHFQVGVVCSADLKKSTDKCLSKDDLNSASSNNSLKDVQLNPPALSNQ